MVRLYTLEEANALLPMLAKKIKQGQRHLTELREAAAQLKDLKALYGEELEQAGLEERADARRWQETFLSHRSELGDLLSEISSLGIEVKDLDLGLVDFHADRAGDIVFLCWRLGEDKIEYWHALEGGFAGRKPLGELADLTPST